MNGNCKILLCVDGTPESLDVVRYAARVLPVKRSEITLFHVMSKVPEVFWDMEKDPKWLEKSEKVKEFEEKQQDSITRFSNECKDILSNARFSSAKISIQISRQRNGIARDIVSEAKKEYDVLILGRGKNREDCTPLGSVASKILSASLKPAVWLVGDVQPEQKNIIVGLDGSENAIRAIKHVGKIVSDTEDKITLFHVVRKLSMPIEGIDEIFPESYQQNLHADSEREFLSIEKLAHVWLNKFDILNERINTRMVSDIKSRAMAILKEAEGGNFSTIVVGKRGVSEVADFPMGRVTNKLIQIARLHALWIVS